MTSSTDPSTGYPHGRLVSWLWTMIAVWGLVSIAAVAHKYWFRSGDPGRHFVSRYMALFDGLEDHLPRQGIIGYHTDGVHAQQLFPDQPGLDVHLVRLALAPARPVSPGGEPGPALVVVHMRDEATARDLGRAWGLHLVHSQGNGVALFRRGP